MVAFIRARSGEDRADRVEEGGRISANKVLVELDQVMLRRRLVCPTQECKDVGIVGKEARLRSAIVGLGPIF
jgi:hypothetical protein